MIRLLRGNSRSANLSDHMRGWIAGYMHQGLAHSPEFEIKLWDYRAPFDYGKKSFSGTEYIVIYGGVLRFEIEQAVDGQIQSGEVVIRGANHEYVVFPPDTIKSVIVVEAPAYGVTVRSPSSPGANKVLQK